MRRLWIRVMSEDEVQEAKEYISGMPKEFLHGDIPVCVYVTASKARYDLDRDCYVCEKALNTLKEKYGENDVVLTEQKQTKDIYSAEAFNISPLERIADALEEIGSNLSMMEFYLENINDNISRCVSPVGSRDDYALNVIGNVNSYNIN